MRQVVSASAPRAALLVVLLAGLAVVGGPTAAAPAQAAAGGAVLTLSVDPVASTYGDPVTASVTLVVDGTPAAGETISLSRVDEPATVLASGATDVDGLVSLSPALATGTYDLVASVAQTPSHASAESAPVTVRVAPSAVRVSLTLPAHVVSEVAVRAVVLVVSSAGGRAVVGASVALRTHLVGSTRWVLVARVRTGSDGLAAVPVRLWRRSQVSATAAATAQTSGGSVSLDVTVSPSARSVWFGHGFPVPRLAYPVGPVPEGSGARAAIGAVPNAVRASMTGYSWHRGCLPFSALRYVSVNYWGFDGYRYRGHLVVAAGIATATSRVFARLYTLGYPIRSIFLPDRYGHHPYGPGANDYASMAADNTYGFNCRYVVGKEDLHVWSPHATGRAIDINTWENPYVSRRGVYPNSWWLPRTRPNRALLRWNSPAVRAFTAAGFSWGASYRDYQHFQLG